MLSEASDKYVKAINRMNIVTFLTSFLLSGNQCPTRVVIAAGQCLNTLTDDNRDICIEFQNHPEYIQSLLNIVNNNNDNTDHVLVQVLACGKTRAIIFRFFIHTYNSYFNQYSRSCEIKRFLGRRCG